MKLCYSIFIKSSVLVWLYGSIFTKILYSIWFKSLLHKFENFIKLIFFLEHVMEETSANIFNVIEILQEKFLILSGRLNKINNLTILIIGYLLNGKWDNFFQCKKWEHNLWKPWKSIFSYFNKTWLLYCIIVVNIKFE